MLQNNLAKQSKLRKKEQNPKENKVKILLFFAMEEESKKTIDHFNFEAMKREDNGLPYQLYKKEIHSNKIYLCNSGIDPKFNVNSVGTVPALTVFDSNKLGIDLVINGYSGRIQS